MHLSPQVPIAPAGSLLPLRTYLASLYLPLVLQDSSKLTGFVAGGSTSIDDVGPRQGVQEESRQAAGLQEEPSQSGT